MTCHRCGGLMLTEQYDDLHDYTGHAAFAGWRCVNCGAVLDPVIAGNRPAESTAGAKVMVDA
jgi:hypothetical protein